MLDVETWRWQIFDLNVLPDLGDDVSLSCWLGTSFLLLYQTEVIPKDQKQKKVRTATYQEQTEGKKLYPMTRDQNPKWYSL